MREKIFNFLKEHKFLLIIIILDTLLVFTFVLPTIVERQWIPTDTYRDIAFAQSLLNGNTIFEDQAINGEYVWYPPLNPTLFSLLSRLTNLDLFKLYAYSPVFILIFIPLVFFFFVNALFRSKKVAFLSVLLMPVMPWVISHFFTMPIPSLHAFVLILPILTYFINSHRKGFTLKNCIIIGVLCGVAFLHHSLSALLTYGAMFLFLLVNRFFRKKQYKWLYLVLILVIPIVMWSPYVLPNLFRPKLNEEPLKFLSDMINEPENSLYMPNKYTFIITLFILVLGFFVSVKKCKQDDTLLVLYYIVGITILFQLLGYIHVLSEKFPARFGFLGRLPYLIPHEFQWHFQFFSLPLIAYAFLQILEIHGIKIRNWIMIMALAVAYLVPPYLDVPKNVQRMIIGGAWSKANEPEYTRWISQYTPVNSVILTSNPQMAFFFVQSYTARKIVYQFDGHTNFNVDNEQRRRDAEIMLKSSDMYQFRKLAAEYEVDYVVISVQNLSQPQLDFFKNNFQRVFRDAGGGTLIFKVNR